MVQRMRRVEEGNVDLVLDYVRRSGVGVLRVDATVVPRRAPHAPVERSRPSRRSLTDQKRHECDCCECRAPARSRSRSRRGETDGGLFDIHPGGEW